MNAKQEFLQHIQQFVKSGVLCAQIKFGGDWSTTEDQREYKLNTQ